MKMKCSTHGYGLVLEVKNQFNIKLNLFSKHLLVFSDHEFAAHMVIN